MLRAHYGFFKQVFGMKARLLFTDTDSLCYLIEAPTVLEEMLQSKKVLFDLAGAFLDSDLEQLAKNSVELDSLKEHLAAMKGRLGALKLENETSFIREFGGLASKMYSLLMVDRDGQQHTHMKGKGVPKRVLASQASHEQYMRMISEPFVSSATFSALRSHNHVVERLQVSKRMLTAFNDKVYQLSGQESRPLGHWRNMQAAAVPRTEETVGSAASSS
jgi:hypothetical protein